VSHPVRIGCSGWNYADWKLRFYPQGCPPSRWLPFYAREFDTVEVNATFYRLTKERVVARWVEQTPPDFVFALKASRYMIHMKKLTGLPESIGRFYEPLRPLVGTPKMGPVLWQLPEWFTRDDERLAGALAELPPGRHCFEFRHTSWFTEDVYALLREHGVALAIGDHRARDPQPIELTTDWTYLRFHYGRRGRRGNYSVSELEEWADRIVSLAARADVFAYFNNDWEAFAIKNARWLKRRLGV